MKEVYIVMLASIDGITVPAFRPAWCFTSKDKAVEFIEQRYGLHRRKGQKYWTSRKTNDNHVAFIKLSFKAEEE